MKIKLLIGLGNPGVKYQNTYHNVGHLFIDYLKTDPKLPARYRLSGAMAGGRIHANLQKTNVYMNESGKYAKAALKKYKLRPKEILVVHDDADIPLGRYKISFGRGSAGHQGIESIIKILQTKNFYRLRVGIRAQRAGAVARRAKADEFVLKKIGVREKKILENLFSELRLRYL